MLREEINSVCGTRQHTLAEAYEVARSRDETTLARYLEGRFHGCKPADWLKNLCTCPWARIWTLNIDDVVETAYARTDERSPKLSSSYSWADSLREEPGLQLVHLHGRTIPGQPLQLIFSIVEYAESIERKWAWYRKFFDDWPALPFITVGARLYNEPDLAQATRVRRSASEDAPSVYVSRSIDDATAEQLEIRNLRPIEISAADFFSEIELLTREHRETRYYQLQSTSTSPADLATFTSEFDFLDPLDDGSLPNHDFYKGDPPRWQDITRGLDARFQWHERLTALVQADMKRVDPVQTCHILLSDKFSGRSVGLYRVAKDIIESGFTGFIFRAKGRMDIESCVKTLAGRGRSVLVFDGIADFADDVSKLLEKCRTSQVSCVVMGVESQDRRHIILSQSDSSFLHLHNSHDGFRIRQLSKDDARQLASKLTAAGRSAKLIDMTEAQRVSFFTGRNIFEAISEMEYGSNFKSRLQPELEALPDDRFRRLVLLVALVGTFGYALPLSLLSAVGISADDLMKKEARQSLSSLLVVEEGQLFARYRSLTVEAARQQISDDDRFDLLVGFLRHLAPYVNTYTRGRRTLPYRLVKSLMRAQSMKGFLGKYQLRSFYDRLQPHYEADARFWEQRSIASRLNEDWAPAHSYAARAVDLAPEDSWRRTTLGRIAIMRSYRDKCPGSPDSWDLYALGVAQLERAMLLDPRSTVPIFVILRESIEFYRNLLLSDIVSEDLETIRHDIEHWYRYAKTHQSLQQTQEHNDLDSLYRLYLRFAVVQETPSADERMRQHVLVEPVPGLTPNTAS
ncbi:P-loop NTPase [Streptomyces sp. NPDC002587]